MVNMVGSCNMLRAPANPVPGAGHVLEASSRAAVVGARMVARGKLADTTFFGAVMSEQAVMRAVAMIALRMRGLRRIIESPEFGKVLPSSTAIGIGYAKSSLPANEDLPTGQGLEANGKPAADTIRDGQRPVTLARAAEPLNRYLKLNVPGMATWKGDQLADEVHRDQAVGA